MQLPADVAVPICSLDTRADAEAARRCARGGRCANREKIIRRPPTCADCGCHGAGLDAPCTIAGGCGHLHAETTTYIGQLLGEESGLCPDCLRGIGYDIAHLKGDVTELTMHIGACGATADDKVSATPEAPTPLRLDLEALRAAIDYEVQAWAEPVAEQLGVDWPTASALRATRLGPRITRAVDLLTSAIGTLIALPPQEHPEWGVDGRPAWSIDLQSDPGRGAWQILERDPHPPHQPIRATLVRTGLDGALHLAELHARAYQLLGRTKLVHRLDARCPWCWQRTLVRDNGADHVQCESSRCRGRAVEERHYSWLVQATIAVEQARCAA